MKHSWDDIVNNMAIRRSADSYIFRQMVNVRDRYNGDVTIPLPEVEGEPTMASLSPQIVADGIDHNAMRAASVIPTISCPAISNKARAHESAAIKRRALYASWHYCGVELLLYRLYRHFIGYGTGSLVVVPDFDEERARIELRDPLTAYPELRSPEDFREPINVGFVFGRSTDWIRRVYPEATPILGKMEGTTLWDIVEWIDEDDIVMGILGPRNTIYSNTPDNRYYPSNSPAGNSMQLRRWPNRAGIVPVAAPRRATLDRIMGQLTHILPGVDFLDRMTALEAIAAERRVFPDMVILGKRTAMPSISGGKWKDGREGEPNIVLDADGMQLLQPSVGPATFATMDRLEQATRMSGGVPRQFGGDVAGARTGRAIDAVAGFSVDPRIMEAQKFVARSLECINHGIMAVEKGYWPDKKYTVFSGWAGDTELIEYTPVKHFDNYHNGVTYPFPGTDISQMTVAVGQLVGAGLMSKDTGRTKHPMIDDALTEGKNIIKEKIDEAILVSFLQQASTGTLPLIDLAGIELQYRVTGDMSAAIQKADELARARQAAQAPPPEAQQPGLAAPGMGAEAAPQPPQAGSADGTARMQALLQALQTRQQTRTSIG